jgi:hypothetical protein
MADTKPRMGGSRMGESAYRWQPMCHELADHGAIRSIGTESVIE